MVQSGAFGVLVVHEQTRRRPLVPCSGEALEPQSQQRAHGLQVAWIPSESRPHLSWPSWPNPSTTGGNKAPVLREETQEALWVSENSAAETKILLALGSALPLPIRGAGPFSRRSQPQMWLQRGSQSSCSCCEVLRGLGTAAAQQGPASNAVWVSLACAELPARAQPSLVPLAQPRRQAALPIPTPLRPAILLLVARARSNPLAGSPSLVRRQAAAA